MPQLRILRTPDASTYSAVPLHTGGDAKKGASLHVYDRIISVEDGVEEDIVEAPTPFWVVTRKDMEMITQLGTCAMSALAEPILGAIDTLCIGRLGVHHMAAMAPNNTVFNMLNTFANLTLAVMVTSAMSAAIGAGRRGPNPKNPKILKPSAFADMTSADCAFNVGATTALAFGVVSAAAFLWLPELCLTAAGTSLETLATAKSYFVIRALGVPVSLLTMVVTAAYSAALDLRTPLLAVIGAGLLNAVLDVLLIFGFGWGMSGAAAATVIAQFTSGTPQHGHMSVRKIDKIRITQEKLTPTFQSFRKIWKFEFFFSASSSNFFNFH